ncbi:MAG TPA: hypothetical protein VFV67_01700 [Actinophytocola sp.]|uniref:hypothetical protein n=1 Tax=Actinophytocola sp. TaxID=1872138 RepID=UPI002DBA5DCE|nr:hypothetical protein [Actinophytocola sp.]HEU5469338.1 hypothetical protein [Actinophytocola sp.]
MRRTWRAVGTILLTGLLLAALTTSEAAADTDNGGFENGDTAGWTVAKPCGGGPGGWFATGSTTTPLIGAMIPPAPEGDFAAVTDQTGPGTHILYQDVAVPPGPASLLSFFLYYRTSAPALHTPDTLDCATGPNQQYRVDLVDPAAPVDTVAVLAEIFRTEAGAPLSLPPTRFTFDLSPYAGQTVRLRFTQVNTEGLFWASVDAVRVEALPHTLRLYLHGVHTPGTAGAFTMNTTPAPAGTLSVNLLTAPTWFSAPSLTGRFPSGARFTLVTPCTLGLAVAPTYRLWATDATTEHLLTQTSPPLSFCLGQRTLKLPVHTPLTLTNQRLKLTVSTPLSTTLTLPLGPTTYLQATNFTGTP